MSNIRKSFNFRYGVQVDEDNFIVNSNGLVGIGTSVPTEFLDVRGNAKVVGLVTANSLFTPNGTVGVLSVTNLTAGGLSAKAGIITATLPYPLGIVTYFGDGGNLLNLPTSQWIDVDTGFGYTSIYAAGNVGVGTTYPDYTFQVGGTPGYKKGVGINSTGDIFLTGIITAGSNGIFGGIGSFAGNLITNRILTVGSGATIAGGLVVGGGATITGNLNFGGTASFNTSGSFGGSLTVGGSLNVSSFGSFGSDLVIGAGATVTKDLNVNQSIISTLDVNSGRHLTAGAGATVGGGFIVGGGATITNNLSIGGNLSAGGNGSVTRDLVVGAGGTFGRNLVVGGGSTISGGLVVGGGLTVTNSQTIGKTLIVGETANVGSTLYVAGVTTIGARLNANTSAIIGNLEINVNPNTIFLNSGDLNIGANGGDVFVNSNLGVLGILTTTGNIISYGGITGNAILVGVNAANRLETSSGDLVIIPSSRNLSLQNNLIATGSISAGSNLNITGIGTIDKNLLVNGAIRGNNHLYVAGITTAVGVSNLDGGANSADIQLGSVTANRISTKSSASELQLDSFNGKVRVLNDFGSDGNFYAIGISSVNNLLPNTDLSGYLGSSSKRFNEAYIDDVRIGVSGASVIESTSGSLTLSSGSGTVEISNDLNISGNNLTLGEIVLQKSGASSFIGINTSSPISPLDILFVTGNLITLRSPSTNRKLTLGYSAVSGSPSIIFGSSNVGSGGNVASLEFDNSNLTLSNEHYGDVTFILDNSSASVGTGTTGAFVWKHGRITDKKVMVLDYNGNVKVSGGVTATSLYSDRIGVGTISARCAVDFRDSGTSATVKYMLPPVITTADRIGLTTVAGAIIYNSTTNKHQGWNGTAWFDFY